MARKKKLSNSRPARWQRAIDAARTHVTAARDAIEAAKAAFSDLKDIQSEYEAWKDNLPENLQGSALADKLETVTAIELEPEELDDMESALDEAEGAELPRGFGRD